MQGTTESIYSATTTKRMLHNEGGGRGQELILISGHSCKKGKPISVPVNLLTNNFRNNLFKKLYTLKVPQTVQGILFKGFWHRLKLSGTRWCTRVFTILEGGEKDWRYVHIWRGYTGPESLSPSLNMLQRLEAGSVKLWMQTCGDLWSLSVTCEAVEAHPGRHVVTVEVVSEVRKPDGVLEQETKGV